MAGMAFVMMSPQFTGKVTAITIPSMFAALFPALWLPGSAPAA
jgi:hypothetical protein